MQLYVLRCETQKNFIATRIHQTTYMYDTLLYAYSEETQNFNETLTRKLNHLYDIVTFRGKCINKKATFNASLPVYQQFGIIAASKFC